MANENRETIADIIAEMRHGLDKSWHEIDREWAHGLADRIEAARKIERDSIHCAKVLIAGIEMENSENPPRLWTALEDAYDALCNADGTDGDIAADVEEAKSTGRHFVVKPFGNAAKMREALEKIVSLTNSLDENCAVDPVEIRDIARNALVKGE